MRFAHHVRDHRRHAAQLRVAEGILGAGIGEELAVGVVHAFGDHDHAVADVGDALSFTFARNFSLSNAISGNRMMCGACVGAFAREPAGGDDPAGMAAHDFHDEHLRRRLGHRGHVERGFARGNRDVLRHGAEARHAVGVRQVVVDGLRHADADDLVAELIADLGHLVSGVHGIVAAVVEEVADVVRLEYFDEALVLGAVLLEALELVARGAESARRRVPEPLDGGAGFLAARR